MNKKPKTRQWALISHGAGAGKSTFLASNAALPLMVVDADNRFDAVEGLADGQVLYPETPVYQTLGLAEELLRRAQKEGLKSLAWDSLTKVYSIHARMGYMRAKAGVSKNKAAEMVEKANVMTIVRDLVMLGTDVYFCWHTTSGVSGAGTTEIRDMISAVERERLETSINLTLEFFKEGNKKSERYGVRVVSARDFAGRRANVGFTLYDEPGNYWRGGADLLESMIYTPYGTKEEAVKWASDKLGLLLEEAEGEYDHHKETVAPKSSGEMFASWHWHVMTLGTKLQAKPVPTEAVEALPEPPESLPEDDVGDDEGDGEDLRVQMAKSELGKLSEPTLGDVAKKAAFAWPGEYTDETALDKIGEYPPLPDTVQVTSSKSVKPETASSILDWLGSELVEF